jgi:ParB-like chromosome segregation protein Spo0J
MTDRFLSCSDSEDQNPKIQLLEISAIRCDCGTQIRASINEATVAEYAEAMLAGATFPPVTVFHDGSQYVLADGFHRLMATARGEIKRIPADVRPGTKTDALKFALGANTAHGLKRTNADKRRSVELALAEWPNLSNREIARICAVHHDHVGDVRKDQLAESATAGTEETNCAKSAVERPRIGRDGKMRRLPNRVLPARTCKHLQLAKADDSVNKLDAPYDAAAIAQIETNDDELQEILSRPLAGIKDGTAYHLNLLRDDAELVLGSIRDNSVSTEQCLAVAIQLKLAHQLLEALARQLSMQPTNN